MTSARQRYDISSNLLHHKIFSMSSLFNNQRTLTTTKRQQHHHPINQPFYYLQTWRGVIGTFSEIYKNRGRGLRPERSYRTFVHPRKPGTEHTRTFVRLFKVLTISKPSFFQKRIIMRGQPFKKRPFDEHRRKYTRQALLRSPAQQAHTHARPLIIKRY